MANPKIPQGYQGTYARAADGSATLIMVSRSDSITDYTEKKEQKPMANNQPTQQQMNMTDGEQPQARYTPYTTEQKKEYAKQFTKREIASYRKGQQSAYAHMGNIGKRNSFFIYNNLQRDGAATPPPAPPAEKPRSTRKNQTGNK